MKKKKNIDDLVDEIEDELVFNPNSLELLCSYSELLLKCGRISKALDVGKQMLDIAPGFSRGRVAYASALLAYNEKAKAYAEYMTAFIDQNSLGPESSFISAVNLFLEYGKHREALCIAERAATEYPKSASLQCLYGARLGIAGQKEKATEILVKAAKLDRNCQELLPALRKTALGGYASPKLQSLLAEEYIKAGNHELAYKALKSVYEKLSAKKKAQTDHLRMQLIQQYFKNGQFDSALELIDEEGGRSEEALSIRSKIYDAIGKKDNTYEETRERVMKLGKPSGDTYETFLDWARNLNWFASIGIKEPWFKDFVWDLPGNFRPEFKDLQIIKVIDWDDYPVGESEEGLLALAEEWSEHHEALCERHPELQEPMSALTKEFATIIKKHVEDYDEGADYYHAPTQAVWSTSYNLALIAGFLQAGEPVPEIFRLHWFFLANGHILCAYGNSMEENDDGPIGDRGVLVHALILGALPSWKAD